MFELAVVPIFVNAGSALLPVLVGALASVLALLLRPRELLRGIRRRPLVALSAAGGAALIWLAASWLASARAASARQADRARGTDWAEVARGIILRQQADLPADAAADAQPTGRPVVLGRDFSRCFYGGGDAPLRLKLLWKHGDADTMFLSSPAVADGKVYGAACILDVTGKYGAVVCLDWLTGRKLWEATTAEPAGPGGGDGAAASGAGASFKPFFSSPAVTADGRHVVIGQGLHDDSDCALLCLEAGTGKVRWQVKTPLHLEGSPAIWKDVVVVGAGAIEGPDRKPAGHAGLVLAVSVSDGKELWRHDLADPESSPAVGDDGTVYIGSGFNGSAVVALRGGSDEELKSAGLARLLWRAPAPYPVTGAVTLAGELVLVGGGNGDYVYADPQPGGAVMALARGSGQVRWQRALDDAVLGALACDGRKVICPVRNGEVVALAVADGKVLWRQRVSGNSAVLAGCALAGDRVYAVSRDGCLAVLDAQTGALLEKHYLNDEARPGKLGLSLSSPTVIAGRLYVGSETGGLRCWAGVGGAAGRKDVTTNYTNKNELHE